MLSGLYNNQALPPFLAVIQPALRVDAGDVSKLKNTLGIILRRILFASTIAWAVVFVNASLLVWVVLGPDWSVAASLLVFLSFELLYFPVASVIRAGALALNRGDRMTALYSIDTFLIGLVLAVSFQFGFEVMLMCYVIIGLPIRAGVFFWRAGSFSR